MGFLSGIWTTIATVRGGIALINRIMDSIIEFQMGKLENTNDERAKERLALAKAMTEAKDDEQRKSLARLIHRLESGG